MLVYLKYLQNEPCLVTGLHIFMSNQKTCWNKLNIKQMFKSLNFTLIKIKLEQSG